MSNFENDTRDRLDTLESDLGRVLRFLEVGKPPDAILRMLDADFEFDEEVQEWIKTIEHFWPQDLKTYHK